MAILSRQHTSIAVLLALASAVLLIRSVDALQGCGGSCRRHADCSGRLACMSGKCGDDPGVGTHICRQQGGGGTCKPSGSFRAPAVVPCNSDNMSDCCKPLAKYHKYTCSPRVSNATSAILTLNGFDAGQDGGGASSCDGKYHRNTERVVALSTGWFANRRRCGRQIQISASNGRSVLATVVDECDSRAGCDRMHAGQPPCIMNDVDASAAVWSALGISESDSRYGYLKVTWKDV
ncbi:hypothetical protein CLOM_g23069 [Closterium sp. NIES-68]|nr:hypothetical protein CLOM_g23069 [Closterium sp. NIES-68]GJP73283.1 hypothetical protein CLOP_g4021 [Closterium sp. NIES-67]